MNILANDGIAASGQTQLEAEGFNVTTEKVAQEELVNAINENNYVALLVRSATKVRKELIDVCPGLKFIGRGGVGMDNIDVEYARSKGIEVQNTPAASSQSVAELVMAHLFSISRSLYDANRQMPSKGGSEFKSLKKQYGKGFELRGKRIGIIGFGRIGQNTAKYALGCGMHVNAYDPFVEKADVVVDIGDVGTVTVGIDTSSMDEVLQDSDVISLHVPAQEDGKAVIGAEEINKMKDGVVIINAARGGVVDETALLEALNNNKVAAAGLDVFENEPTPDQKILDHPRISLTPHIGAATSEAQERIGTELAEKIISCLK